MACMRLAQVAEVSSCNVQLAVRCLSEVHQYSTDSRLLYLQCSVRTTSRSMHATSHSQLRNSRSDHAHTNSHFNTHPLRCGSQHTLPEMIDHSHACTPANH